MICSVHTYCSHSGPGDSSPEGLAQRAHPRHLLQCPNRRIYSRSTQVFRQHAGRPGEHTLHLFQKDRTDRTQQHRVAAHLWGREDQKKCSDHHANTIRLARAAMDAHCQQDPEVTPGTTPQAISTYGSVEQWKNNPTEWAINLQHDLDVERVSHSQAKKFLDETTHLPVLFYDLVHLVIAQDLYFHLANDVRQ